MTPSQQILTEPVSVAIVGRPGFTGNFLWSLAGNLTYSLCQWAMVMSLAKFGSTEMVGQFALGLAITAPVFQFFNLQLRTVQVTDARDQHMFRDYLGMRIVTSAAALFIVGLLTLWTRYPAQTALVVVLIGMAKTIESLSDIFQGLFQKDERMDRVAQSLIFKGLLSLAFVVLALRFSGNIVVACGMLVLAWATVFLVYDLRKGRAQFAGRWVKLIPRFDRSVFTKLFLLTLPLGFVMMLLSLNSNLPRYFLARHVGESAVGIFSALMYCIVAGSTVINALGQTATPRLAKLYGTGNLSAFRALLAKLLVFGAAIGFIGLTVALFLGREILTLLYRPEYAQQARAFFWLMLAGGVMNVSGFLGVAVTAMRGFKQQAWIHLCCTVVGLAASAVLIPARGILGAAISVLILAVAGLLGFSIQLVLMMTRQQKAPPQIARSL
jgi:O-antigen/teichoic acid export membrane protein